MNNIDSFVQDLLHIDEPAKNKMLDLDAGKENTYYLTYGDPEAGDDLTKNGEHILKIIREHIGKVGNTVLRGSAADGEEQLIGAHRNVLNWCSRDGQRSPKELDKYIKAVYREVDLTGNNPLFLSVGTVSWKMVVGRDETKVVETPFLIFPIRLIRSVATSPIAIEFVDEDIYVNPCFVAKMRQVYGDSILAGFPSHTEGDTDFDAPVDLARLGDGKEYFDAVEQYINACRGAEKDSVFAFDRNVVAISQYDHDEICMYYDIKRNKERVYSHPIVQRLFTESLEGNIPPRREYDGIPSFILPTDRVQEDMIRRVLAGESLIIKGPPGTGKTLTIVNMIATLLEEGKRVMLASEKLAALSEVYNKLPDELRDFVMLLACETESQAAKLNPSVVKKDLSDLVRAADQAVALSSAIYSDKSSVSSQMSYARRAMNQYFGETFKTKDVIDMSYYEALDIVEKHPELTVPCVIAKNGNAIPYADPRAFIGMPREVYNEMYNTVVEAARYFGLLTADGKHPMVLCPWYPVEAKDQERAEEVTLKNTDRALELYRKISSTLAPVIASLRELFASEGISDIGAMNLTSLRDLLAEPISRDTVLEYFEKSPEALPAIAEAYIEAFGIDEKKLDTREVGYTDTFASEWSFISNSALDPSLTREDIEELYKHSELLYGTRMIEMLQLTLIIDKIKKEKEAILTHRENLYDVFPTNLTPEGLERIQAAVPLLAKYRGKKQPMLFFGAPKTAFLELCELSYLRNPTFEQIVGAVCELEDIMICDNNILELDGELASLFKRTISPEEREAIIMLYEKALTFKTTAIGYLEFVCSSYGELCSAFDNAGCKCGGTVADVREAYAAADAMKKLAAALGAFFADGRYDSVGSCTYPTFADMKKTARRVLAVCGFIFTDAAAAIPTEQLAAAVETVSANGASLAFAIAEQLAAIEACGKETFPTSYSEYTNRIRISDMDIFLAECNDKAILNAASRYLSERGRRWEKYEVSLIAFFNPFERGLLECGSVSYADIFENSAYRLACLAKRATFETVNGRGDEIARQMDIYGEADDKLREFNVKTIRESCIERVKAEDKNAFAFLNSSRDNINNLRRIFKLHGESILKLKKCMLVSPGAVSVLFGSPAFSEFDVLIVDEASQLEPTKILPVLFRSKQLVLVGDEWQMPPIKHFSKAAEHTVVSDQGTLTNLSPETSVLALALHSKQFDTCELVCHYRSKTESLIAFSQSRYYPYMRTFPASVPRAAGLGFKDVYIPDGKSEGGVNAEEAAAAVRELEEHFNIYYDENTGVLSESVGIVAFGESQLSKIESLIKSNLQLKAKIARALDNFDDLPEKLIFFKTIETVQGQETDHMIISLTYGKGKDGRVREAYGDLGRSAFGECIFNVAVTRARASVTLIHSVLHTEIENKFIKGYLEIAEKFDKDGRMQFISEGDVNRPGFIRSVADYIINEVGIAEERVVINCGATNGSVRVPIVILSPDMSEAQLAIWCEKNITGRDYIDGNIRYYNILRSRGWKLHRVFIHDWFDNKENEKLNIANAIRSCVTINN